MSKPPDRVSIFETLLRRTLTEYASTPGDRQRVYREFHLKLVNLHTDIGSADYREDNFALQEAIANIERQSRVAALGSAAIQDERGWFERLVAQIKDIGIYLKWRYGALAGIISFVSDFLKPILDFTGPLCAASAVVAGICTVVARRPGRMQREVKVGAAFFGVMMVFSGGLLATQHMLPKAQARGLTTTAFPGLAGFQDAVLASFTRIERKLDEVGAIVERENDPVFIARREITRAGYKIENSEFIRAVAAGDSSSENQFQRLGVSGDIVSLRAGLLAQVFGSTQFENLLNFVVRMPTGHYAKTLMTEAQQFAQSLKAQNSLDRFRKDICETQPIDFFLILAAKDLKAICKDEPRWFEQAVDITQQLARRLGEAELWKSGEAIPFHALTVRQVKPEEFIQLISGQVRALKPEIVSARVAVVFVSESMRIYSQNMKEGSGLNWVIPLQVKACSEQDGLYPVCEATVSAFLSGKDLARAIAVSSVAPNPNMRSISSFASTQGAGNPKWLIGVMTRPNPYYSISPDTRDFCGPQQ